MARFATRAELHAWLEEQGLAHVARFNLEAVAPRVDPGLWPALRALGARRRLTDLASEDGVSGSGSWLGTSPLRDVLPRAVEAFIEDERVAAERARLERSSQGSPPVQPERSRGHGISSRPGGTSALDPHGSSRPSTPLGVNGVLALRARLPSGVAPRLFEALRPEDLRFDPTLPGFRWKDLLPTERALRAGGGFSRAEVKVSLRPGEEKVECTCALGPCVHALAAIDTVLLAWPTLPKKTLEELSRPAWQRTLAALEEALQAAPPVVSPGAVSWHLHVDEQVYVTAFIGDAPTSRQALLQGHSLTAAEARIAALLPEEGEPASRALIEALVDQPRIRSARAESRARDPLDSRAHVSGDGLVHVERAAVGLVAEERLGAVKVGAALEGAPLPPSLAERVRRAKPDELLFLWDEGPRRLTLLDLKPELQRVLELLQRSDSLFPPESHAALLDSLSKWAQRVPVAMPRSVLGESVPAGILPVLRLEARPKGAVEVEVRVRALPDAPALVPGEGGRDVHLRRGDRPMHAVRDLTREVTEAQRLCRELGLVNPEEGPFRFRFERGDEVLSLMERCTRRDPAPIIEWVGTPLRSLGGTGARALKVQVEQRNEWFGVLGSLSVEGERVELARLLDAARRRERWVQVTEFSWVELNETLRRHLEHVAYHTRVTKLGLLVGPAATEPLRALQDAGATVEADASWRTLTERIEASRTHRPKAPRGLKAKLRPYQLEGFQWLSRLAEWGAGAVLADDMGLGKTVQALALLLERASKGPALVVAPTSVAFNWKEEAARFAPGLKVQVYADLADRDVALGPKDVLIVSYGLLVRDAKALSTRRFATVVFDEAQQLKNAQTQRFHAAKALRAEFRVALSGTPIENHLGELWSLFAVVFPPLLGPWESFRERFAGPIEQAQRVSPHPDPLPRGGEGEAMAMARVLEPFLLRRTKAEVATELPPRTEVKVPVVLSAEEWQLYEDTRLAALSDLETTKRKLKEQERKVQVLALLTRLRLVACHPRLYVEHSTLTSSKLTRLLELLEELRAEEQRSLVFSQFTSHLDLVRAALDERGIASVSLDGRTSAKDRAARIAEFSEGTAPVFLLSLKAGGVGLNLTAATNVIHLDPWWNPAVEDQASDRAHRMGQLRPVTIYRLVSMGTVEEQMLALHARKRSLVDGVLAGKGRAAKLSTAELLALLRSPEARS